MTQLIATSAGEYGSADSPVGFEREGGGQWAEWDRFLTLDGRRAYHIGNVCNTCSFFFERLEGANRSLTRAEELIGTLTAGATQLDESLAREFGRFLPVGRYIAVLVSARPTLVRPGAERDYFCRERIDLWGVDAFWGLPHDPRTEYYRVGSRALGDGRHLFEFLVPMFPRGWLEDDRVEEFRQLLASGGAPTALAISVLDVKQPALWDGDPDVTAHWCLTHYLLDGHHKTYAASLGDRPLTVLSYLAIGQGISEPAQCELVVRALAAPDA
jgi:hypothetical protein